uniref:Uncharacterized protein n=1 Tax=Arundo donax TaxID=35708 RepID=A0A0A8ZB32_ARUDO
MTTGQRSYRKVNNIKYFGTEVVYAIGNVFFVQCGYQNWEYYHEINNTYEVDQEFVKFYDKLARETMVQIRWTVNYWVICHLVLIAFMYLQWVERCLRDRKLEVKVSCA